MPLARATPSQGMPVHPSPEKPRDFFQSLCLSLARCFLPSASPARLRLELPQSGVAGAAAWVGGASRLRHPPIGGVAGGGPSSLPGAAACCQPAPETSPFEPVPVLHLPPHGRACTALGRLKQAWLLLFCFTRRLHARHHPACLSSSLLSSVLSAPSSLTHRRGEALLRSRLPCHWPAPVLTKTRSHKLPYAPSSALSPRPRRFFPFASFPLATLERTSTSSAGLASTAVRCTYPTRRGKKKRMQNFEGALSRVTGHWPMASCVNYRACDAGQGHPRPAARAPSSRMHCVGRPEMTLVEPGGSSHFARVDRSPARPPSNNAPLCLPATYNPAQHSTTIHDMLLSTPASASLCGHARLLPIPPLTGWPNPCQSSSSITTAKLHDAPQQALQPRVESLPTAHRPPHLATARFAPVPHESPPQALTKSTSTGRLAVGGDAMHGEWQNVVQ